VQLREDVLGIDATVATQELGNGASKAVGVSNGGGSTGGLSSSFSSTGGLSVSQSEVNAVNSSGDVTKRGAGKRRERAEDTSHSATGPAL
jgi:hypothetical protein